MDRRLVVIGALWGIGALAVVAALALAPEPPESSAEEIPERFVELRVQRPEKPVAGEGAKAKREEGKVGKRDAAIGQAEGLGGLGTKGMGNGAAGIGAGYGSGGVVGALGDTVAGSEHY